MTDITAVDAMRKALAEGRLHEIAPNTEQIRAQATRVVSGRIPAQVRRELAAMGKPQENTR